jgi:hypothetical protein
MGNGLAEDLAALGTVVWRSRPLKFDGAPNAWFAISRPKRLFGIIPYNSFAGNVMLGDYGDYWRVVLSDPRRKNGQLIGADIRKDDAARLDAWKFASDSRRWLPVWVEADEIEIFEQIEDSIRIAARGLPAMQS